MKAIRLHEPVGVEGLVYEEAPDPTPAFGNVLVKVHACGITPTELDWPIWTDRAGHKRDHIIPGYEFSGGVAALGFGTAGLAVGDEVYGLVAAHWDGAAAEYIAVEARGRGVTIVDQQAEGANTSRASVVYSRTLEVLDPYGVAERLVARGIHAQRFTIRDRDKVLMTVPFDRLPTTFPYTLLVSQAVTQAVLLQRLTEMGGQVLRPCTLTGLDQDDSGVTATFASGERIRARYLVGADGMHSTVREQAHIGFRAEGSGTSYALADVHLSGGVPRDEVAVYFSPRVQLVSVPFPDGSYKIHDVLARLLLESGHCFTRVALEQRGVAPRQWLLERRRCDVFLGVIQHLSVGVVGSVGPNGIEVLVGAPPEQQRPVLTHALR